MELYPPVQNIITQNLVWLPYHDRQVEIKPDSQTDWLRDGKYRFCPNKQSQRLMRGVKGWQGLTWSQIWHWSWGHLSAAAQFVLQSPHPACWGCEMDNSPQRGGWCWGNIKPTAGYLTNLLWYVMGWCLSVITFCAKISESILFFIYFFTYFLSRLIRGGKTPAERHQRQVMACGNWKRLKIRRLLYLWSLALWDLLISYSVIEIRQKHTFLGKY